MASGAQQEDAKQGEEKDECPWCRYMKGGGCREQFEVGAAPASSGAARLPSRCQPSPVAAAVRARTLIGIAQTLETCGTGLAGMC